MRSLYFIQNTAYGIVKIGVSHNVRKRCATIQCMCGVPCAVLGTLPNGEKYEHWLHGIFADVRLEGEWFLPVPELIKLARAPHRVHDFACDINERQRLDLRRRGQIFQESRAYGEALAIAAACSPWPPPLRSGSGEAMGGEP